MKKSKILLSLCVFVIGVFSCSLFGAEGSQSVNASSEDVLKAVPADAWGVIVIKNLSKFSKSVDDYASKLGAECPELEKRLVRKLGVGKLVDMNSPMAIVIMNKQLYGNQPIATVLNVGQYEKFAASLNGQVTETPGIMKGKNDELGECYFSKKGSLVVIGPTQMIVNAVVSSKQSLGAVINKEVKGVADNSSLYVHVNLPALVTVVKPYLMMFSAMGMMGGMGPMMQGQGDNQPSGINEQQMQQMQALSAGINAIVGVLDELNSLDIGVSLEPEMIKGSGILGFKPGQEMAGLLALQKPTDKPLLVGIPGGEFGIAGGMNWEGKLTKFQEAMLKINSVFIKNPETVQKYLDLAKQSTEIVKGAAFKLALVQSGKDKPVFLVQAVQKTSDSKKYLDIMQEIYGIMGTMHVPGQKGALSYKYNKGAGKVDGLRVDELVIDMGELFKAAGKNAKAKEAEAVLKILLGSSKLKVKFVPVTDKCVAIQFGGTDENLEALIKTVQDKTSPIDVDPRVVKVAKLLPKERIGEFYLDLGGFVSGVMNIAMKFAPTGKDDDDDADEVKTAEFPKLTTPLIGKTVTVVGSAFKCDVVVPFATIQKMSGLKGMFEAMMPEKGESKEKDKD